MWGEILGNVFGIGAVFVHAFLSIRCVIKVVYPYLGKFSDMHMDIPECTFCLN